MKYKVLSLRYYCSSDGQEFCEQEILVIPPVEKIELSIVSSSGWYSDQFQYP